MIPLRKIFPPAATRRAEEFSVVDGNASIYLPASVPRCVREASSVYSPMSVCACLGDAVYLFACLRLLVLRDPLGSRINDFDFIYMSRLVLVCGFRGVSSQSVCGRHGLNFISRGFSSQSAFVLMM